jgi:predicted metalloprotease
VAVSRVARKRPATSADWRLAYTTDQQKQAAATVIGDDFEQRRATGTVRPESWTRGSSRQRQQWLTTGFTRGDPSACDTFGP